MTDTKCKHLNMSEECGANNNELCDNINDCYFKLKQENEELRKMNAHFNYLISSYHICFEGALGAMEELLKKDCKDATYYTQVAKNYLSYRYKEQQEAKDIYDAHFQKLKEKYDKTDSMLFRLNEELLKIVEPRMSDFTDYNEETNSFDIVLAIKEIIEDLEDTIESKEISIKDFINQYKLAHNRYMKYQTKLKRIEEFINDYGAMQSDADCGLPIGILQIIEGEEMNKLKRYKLHIKLLNWIEVNCRRVANKISYYIHLEGSYRQFERQREALNDIKNMTLNNVCESCPTYGCDECFYQDVLNCIRNIGE